MLNADFLRHSATSSWCECGRAALFVLNQFTKCFWPKCYDCWSKCCSRTQQYVMDCKLSIGSHLFSIPIIHHFHHDVDNFWKTGLDVFWNLSWQHDCKYWHQLFVYPRQHVVCICSQYSPIWTNSTLHHLCAQPRRDYYHSTDVFPVGHQHRP